MESVIHAEYRWKVYLISSQDSLHLFGNSQQEHFLSTTYSRITRKTNKSKVFQVKSSNLDLGTLNYTCCEGQIRIQKLRVESQFFAIQFLFSPVLLNSQQDQSSMIFSFQSSSSLLSPALRPKLIRSDPFFFCTERQQSSSKANFIHQYHLVGLANPYHCHLLNFQTLSPTSARLTKQLVAFMIDCIRTYRSKNKQQQLLQNFFPPTTSTNHQQKLKALCNSFLEKKQQELDRLSLAEYPTTRNLLLETLDHDSAEYVARAFESNLKKYRILSRSQKLQNMKKLVGKLSKFLAIEIITLQEKEEVLIRIGYKESTSRLVTLEELVRMASKPYDGPLVSNKRRTVLVTEEKMETLTRKVYNDIINYNKSMSTPYGSMYDKCYYRPHPTNILAHIQTQSPFSLELNPEGLSLDFISLFLDEIGLEGRPCSLEQMLIKGVNPSSLAVYDFSEVIKKKQERHKVFALKEKEVASILCWLLTVDYINKKLLFFDGESPFQRLLNPQQLYDSIESKQADCLSDSTLLLISVYQLCNQEDSMLLLYCYNKWLLVLKEEQNEVEEQYLNSTRFCRAKIMTESLERFFKGERNLIQNIKENPFLKETPNVALYLSIYLFYKYEELTLEESILMANYNHEIISEEKYCLSKTIKEIQEHLKKRENKISRYFKEKDTDNAKFIKNNPEMIQFYQNVALRKLEHFTPATTDGTAYEFQPNLNDLKKEEGRIADIKAKIIDYSFRLLYYMEESRNKKLKQMQQAKHDYLFSRPTGMTPDILTFLQQELLMQIFFHYDMDHYSDLKVMEPEVWEFSSKLKDASRQDIRKKFSMLSNEIEKISQKAIVY